MLSLACGQSPAPSHPNLCTAGPVSGPQRAIILYYSDPPTLSPQTTQLLLPVPPWIESDKTDQVMWDEESYSLEL